MKLISVNPYNLSKEEITIINDLLSKQMINEYLLKNSFLELKINIDSGIEFIYRRLFEEVYLNQTVLSTLTSSHIEMKLAIIDAIEIIHTTVPPIVLKKYGEPKSIQEIMDILVWMFTFKKPFAIDTFDHVTTDIEYEYHGFFKQTARLMPFDTIWNHDDTKLNYVYNLSEKMTTVIDSATIPYQEILKPDKNKSYRYIGIQFTIIFDANTTDINSVLGLIQNEKIHIVNINRFNKASDSIYKITLYFEASGTENESDARRTHNDLINMTDVGSDLKEYQTQIDNSLSTSEQSDAEEYNRQYIGANQIPLRLIDIIKETDDIINKNIHK